MTEQLQYNQAVTILKQRADAHDDLITFARIIDIPAVPLDVGKDDWSVVETALADHHLLTLYALESMVYNTLRYDPQTLEPITIPTPEGLVLADALRPVRVPLDGGGGYIKKHPPSLNPTSENIPHDTTQPIGQQKQQLENSDTTKVPKNTGVILPRTVDDDGIQVTRENIDLLIGDRLSRVCKRVMLMMPPGSAKSTYASVVFPSWQLGRVPDEEMILTGWGDPICKKHGKRARTICSSELYNGIFQTGLDPNTRAAEDWALTNGSTYKSSGINSGIAGFRCNGLVWDDLTKNRKEADSPTIRDDTYNAYIDDARSRKKPDGWEVGIGTRWHEDEIMGRILPDGYAGESGYLQCRDGNVWLVICLAAECESAEDPLNREIGEMIWHEWFGEDYWHDKRINPRSWASLYQQRPAPEEGIFFKREWFKRYDVLPEGDNWIGLDPAVTDEEDFKDADDTAILIWRVDQHARFYLIDEWVRKCTMDVWIGELIKIATKWKPMEICSESGVIRRAAEPFIKRAMIQAKSFFKFNWAHRSANKSAMARGAQALCSSGQVYVPNNSVGDQFIDDCLRFPASKKDHRVDAFVNLCMRLEFIWEANPPEKEVDKSTIIGESITIKGLMPERFPKQKSRWSRKHSLH